jgi:hypothetical protein
MGRLRPPTPSLIKETADYFNLFVAANDIKEQLTEMWLHHTLPTPNLDFSPPLKNERRPARPSSDPET